MKKFFIVFTAMAFVLGLSLAAMADVDVTGVVTKTKTKTVVEVVDVYKDYDVTVDQKVFPENSAEAEAVKNDDNTDNEIDEDPVTKNATIDAGSGSGSGVIGINQSPGSMNNQGNATAVAVTAEGEAFLHSQASAQKNNEDNDVNASGVTRIDLIDASLNSVSGVLGVNQSAGSMNNQNNANSMAVGTGSIAALSEADLGMVNTDNYSWEGDVTLTDTIGGTGAALTGANGIVGVNQSSGCMNNQANVVAISVLSRDFTP